MTPVVIVLWERETDTPPFKEYTFKLHKQGDATIFKTFHFKPENFEEEIVEVRKEIQSYLDENGYVAVSNY